MRCQGCLKVIRESENIVRVVVGTSETPPVVYLDLRYHLRCSDKALGGMVMGVRR